MSERESGRVCVRESDVADHGQFRPRLRESKRRWESERVSGRDSERARELQSKRVRDLPITDSSAAACAGREPMNKFEPNVASWRYDSG